MKAPILARAIDGELASAAFSSIGNGRFARMNCAPVDQLEHGLGALLELGHGLRAPSSDVGVRRRQSVRQPADLGAVVDHLVEALGHRARI
jgi:hypothetical protein